MLYQIVLFVGLDYRDKFCQMCILWVFASDFHSITYLFWLNLLSDIVADLISLSYQ